MSSSPLKPTETIKTRAQIYITILKAFKILDRKVGITDRMPDETKKFQLLVEDGSGKIKQMNLCVERGPEFW